MQAETVAALVAPGVTAHDERTALRAAGDGPERTYDYARLRTDAQKTGNLLSHQGVRDGRRLGVVADSPVPEAVLGLLGAALTGAVVRFDPPRTFDGRAVLSPVGRVDEYDLPAGGRRIGYGDAPDDPAVVHFEEEMWSENPTAPPPRVDPGDPVLATADGEVTHREVVTAAGRLVDDGLGDDSVVLLRASLAAPGTVAALVAALSVGATVLLDADDGGPAHTHAVASGAALDPAALDPRS